MIAVLKAGFRIAFPMVKCMHWFRWLFRGKRDSSAVAQYWLGVWGMTSFFDGVLCSPLECWLTAFCMYILPGG